MTKFKYIFYRILGNDLPPRHKRGQTLANLKTILDREPFFENVDKRWIINRIVDPQYEESIIRELEKFGQKYQIIHFDRKKFRKIPKECYTERLEELIGLNKVRNQVLKEGKRLGQWVLVFDGNCFFTSQAWQEVSQACLMSGDIKYLVVPMMRMIAGLKGVKSEPQIIFRQDSKEEFDVDFGYGHDSKVELLRRLGVPGVWDQWDRKIKGTLLKRKSKEFGLFTTAGHVWRLPSGNEAAEQDIHLRRKYRNRGIHLLMEMIDKAGSEGNDSICKADR